MAELKLNNTTTSNLTEGVNTFNVAPQEVDRANEGKETTWVNHNWGTYLGYYNTIPEQKQP